MTCATAVTFLQAMGPLAIGPTFPALIEEFDSNLADVVQFTGIAILVLGFSNFIWYSFLTGQDKAKKRLMLTSVRVPLSTSFGRRPVYIASTTICLASSIWRARAQSYNSFYGACVLNGIAAGPGEVGFSDTLCRTVRLMNLRLDNST